MSDELTFKDLIYHLTQNSDPSARAEAARILGNFVDELSDQEYQIALHALNHSLTDPDPQVLMATMSALGHYNRNAPDMTDSEADDDSSDEAVMAETCAVCGKPAALVDPTDCPHASCPYK